MLCNFILRNYCKTLIFGVTLFSSSSSREVPPLIKEHPTLKWVNNIVDKKFKKCCFPYFREATILNIFQRLYFRELSCFVL